MPRTLRFEELPALVGQEVALSGWFEVGQARIDAFADATDDRQWIHVDPGRCARESPFGGTVAHGFLSLSLLPAMLDSALRIEGMRMGLNYGLDKVRFPAPLPAGYRLGRRKGPARPHPAPGGLQLSWDVRVEREGGEEGRPVCAAAFLVRCYA